VGIVNFHDSFLQRYCVACSSNTYSCDRACGQGLAPLRIEVKALDESVFGPCTPWRTWGTRPEPKAVAWGSSTWFVVPRNDLVEVGLGDDLLVVEGGQLAVDVCGAWPGRSCQ
jgi:hypothetical protein